MGTRPKLPMFPKDPQLSVLESFVDSVTVVDSWDQHPNGNNGIWAEKLPLIAQVVSGQTFFVARAGSSVYTWGDERFSACLGREITRYEPASERRLIADLHGLPTGPIVKIAAGGYVAGALTEGRDLYLWGMSIKNTKFELSGDPSPLELHGMDIVDIAIGDGHIVVLGCDGTNRSVWVIGEGRNGQLGLGPGVTHAEDWTEVDVSTITGAGKVIAGVVAGPMATFLLVNMP